MQKKCNFMLWDMIKAQLYMICFSSLMFEALSFHYTGKNRQKKLQMAHNWIPSQTSVMCMSFYWGNSNSSPDVSVVATVWHTENWRNMRTMLRKGAFLHRKLLFILDSSELLQYIWRMISPAMKNDFRFALFSQ